MSQRRRRGFNVPTPHPTRLRESATAVAETTSLRETSVFGEAQQPTADGSLIDVQLIRAGWGSSGFYSAEVLSRDMARAFPAGTHQYIDHPTVTEESERPERSVRDLAAVLVEDPYTTDGGQTFRARARVFGPYREFIREAWQDIGVSIRALGTAQPGEAEGRTGMIVQSLAVGESVDFVTRAGAGGRIVSLLESARQTNVREARTVGAWLESRLHLALTQYADDMYGDGRLTRPERIILSGAIGDGLQAWTARVEADAPQLFQRGPWDEPAPAATATGVVEARRLSETTTDQTRTALSAAVRTAYAADKTFVWVRDFDPDRGLVWFEISDSEGCTTWQQAYTASGADAETVSELTGDRTEVVAQTVYTAVPAAATDSGGSSPNTPVTESVTSPTQPPPPAAATDVTGGTPPTAPAPHPPTEGSAAVTAPNAGSAPDTQAGTQTSPATQVNEADRALTAQLAEAQRERDTERQRAEAAELRERQLTADQTGRDSITRLLAESNVDERDRALIAPRVTAQVIGRVPLAESGDVDQTALDAAITAAITAESTYLATAREAAGVGTVSGLGGTNTAPAADAAQTRSALVESYKARGLSDEAARLAAAGRPA